MSILRFQDAVEHHHKWLQDLRTCLLGEKCDVHIDDILRDNNCVIGRWLYGEGMEFTHLSQYRSVKAHHKKMHNIAQQAWQAKIDGAQGQIIDLLHQLDDAKHAMFLSWNNLNSVIGNLE